MAGQGKNLKDVKYMEEITIFIEGGVIQDIIDIPVGTEVKVVDWDIDGIEEGCLSDINGRIGLVSHWEFTPNTTYDLHTTRFEGLGYIQQDSKLWRVVDIHDGRNTIHVVGPQYRSQAELLGDLDRYAKETWGY